MQSCYRSPHYIASKQSLSTLNPHGSTFPCSTRSTDFEICRQNAALRLGSASAGQERRLLEGSRHVASTVEMANLSHRVKVQHHISQTRFESTPLPNMKKSFSSPAHIPRKASWSSPTNVKQFSNSRGNLYFQVAVVDEVQMLGDPFRGPSFTRAILGLPAEELHLCGDPAVLPLLKALAQEAGGFQSSKLS